MATSPSGSGHNQHLTPVISTKPKAATVQNITNVPPPQQIPKQPNPTQASPSKTSPSSSLKQPVTPVISTKPITTDGENTIVTLPIQQNPKQSSPIQETQIILVVNPESTDANKSESSGTTESGKGALTRLRAITKGKELKGVNKAEDPEAKAKLLRALARQKKENEQKVTTDVNEQDKSKVELNSSPQPKPSNTEPQVRCPVVTSKTDASVTTLMRSPSTKTSSSTPSDLTKSDSSETKARTSTDPQEEPKDIANCYRLQLSKIWTMSMNF